MKNDIQYDTLLLLGAPGCGKETQAKLLTAKFGWKHSATGDKFRELAKADTEEGRRLREELKTPNLLSGSYVYRFLEEDLSSLSPGQGIILDGYCRDEEQALRTRDILADRGRTLVAMCINVHEDELCRRMERRALEQHRTDSDTDEKRRARINVYRAHGPAVRFVFAHRLVQVNGNFPPQRVHEIILSQLHF